MFVSGKDFGLGMTIFFILRGVRNVKLGLSSTRRAGIALRKVGELQVYVISGTVAQLYFTKEDSTPKRVIRSSLRRDREPRHQRITGRGSFQGNHQSGQPINKRRLKRIKDRFREMTLWFEQVMLEDDDDEQVGENVPEN